MAKTLPITAAPASKPDINTIEQALYDAGNLAGILHAMLDNIGRLPVEVMGRASPLLSLTEYQRNQLAYLANRIREAIHSAESGIA